MKLDKLTRIDLREVWNDEARNFTPWLSDDANLALLGESLGIDLTLIERESNVGDFNVDIFAKEEGTDRKIIIENQLEDTDHDHLGKLITYASGKDADVVVWIVKRARDEHKQAIEWLNQHTDDKIAFFLIEIELWRIGNSDIAPKFNVVERPNDWAKAQKQIDNLSKGEATKLEFWQAFNSLAQEDSEFTSIFNLRKPSTDHWYNLSVGNSSINISLTINTLRKNVHAGLIIYEDMSTCESFKSHTAEIEHELEGKTQWREASKQVKFFVTLKKNIDFSNTDDVNQACEWLRRKAITLKSIAKEYANG